MAPPDSIHGLPEPCLPPLENEMSRRYLRMLEAWIPVGVEYFDDWPQKPNCGHFLGGCHWYGNETAGPSEAFALASLSPEYESSSTHVSRGELRRMAIGGLRYLCFTHDTGPAECLRPREGLGRPENCGRKWGEKGRGFFPESQCGPTVSSLARICLLLRSELDDETLSMVARIHEDYAERFGGMEPRSGVYVDTQMEENAWTSLGLTSCYLFLSGHERARAWESVARRWMFSTCSAPQDAKNLGMMGDSTIRDRTGKVFTVLPDYWAENHGTVHPNYTASGVNSLMNVGSQLALWGRRVPEELRWNRQRIYENLKALTDGGGYPQAAQGMDWHYLPTVGVESPHAVASVFFSDPDAAALQRGFLHNSELRQRGNHGRLYDRYLATSVRDQQDPMIMRELAIWAVARLYLFHRLFGPGATPTSQREVETKLLGVRTYRHAGFTHHRHSAGQTSLSWRNSVMALPLTREGIYTIAPRMNSWLGTPSVRDSPDSHELLSAKVTEYGDAFSAALLLHRCQGSLRQEVLFASLPDGRVLSFERFIARRRLVIQSLDQGLVSIVKEYFPLLGANSRGTRDIYTSSGIITSRGFVSRTPEDDSLKELVGTGHLNIDDRVGLKFSGSGIPLYHSRHFFEPYRAVADDLILSRHASPRSLLPGDNAGSLAAVIVPGQEHSLTPFIPLHVALDGEAGVCLTTDGYMAVANFGRNLTVMRFRVPRGEKIQIFPDSSLVASAVLEYSFAIQPRSAALLRATGVTRISGQVRIDSDPRGDSNFTGLKDGSLLKLADGSEFAIPEGGAIHITGERLRS